MGSTGGDFILFDYEFSPFSQKVKFLLKAANIPFQRVDQPPVLPRPDLEALGVTYRRIPVLAIGKDIYCDTALIYDVILRGAGKGKIGTSAADKAWEAWSQAAFADILTLVPGEFLTDDFIKDRDTIFPILGRSDYKTLRPSGITELQSRMNFLENTALASSPFIGGDKLSVADIHAFWPIRWGLFESGPPGLGAQKEPGLGKDKFHKVWKLMENLPDVTAEAISGEEAIKRVKGASHSSKLEGVMEGDPCGIKAGTSATVDSLDSAPHSHPQAGKLIATTQNEIVLEVDNGVRVHFPRETYILREA